MMSDNAEKPEVSLKDKEEIHLKVSSAPVSENSSELIVPNPPSESKNSKDDKVTADMSTIPDGGAGGGREQKANSHGLTIDETSSSGLIRHKIVVAACLCVSLSLLFLNSFDLKHLIERDAKLVGYNMLTSDKPLAELPPELNYKEEGSSYWGNGELLPVYKSSWKGKLYGFVDRSGKLVIKPQFTDTHGFANGLAPVEIGEGDNSKWGYIDSTGKWVIAPKYKQAYLFVNRAATVSLDKRQILIDRTGQLVSPQDFFNINWLKDGLVVKTAKMRSGILDFSGKWILPPIYSDIRAFRPIEPTTPPSHIVPNSQYQECDPNTKYLKIRKQDMIGVATPEGKVLVEPKYENVISYNKGIPAVSVDGKIGFIDDKTGKFLIRPQFDYATPYDSIIAVKQQGKWFLINNVGEPISSTPIDKVITGPEGEWFSDGLGAVVVNQKVGYVNEKGELLIKPTFDIGTVFSNKHALVYSEDRFRVIDAFGTPLPSFEFGDVSGGYEGQISVKIPGPLYGIVESSKIKETKKSIRDWMHGKSNFYYQRRGWWE